MAEVLDVQFKRIQFTPDLLPADLTGTMIYRQQTGEFVARKGPVFTNIILADEINRAPAKVQSALLEAMQEGQVTIGDTTFPLAKPFFVLATQNPIEQEGTYQLPEAQLDRFIMKILVSYPQAKDELAVLRRMGVEHDIPVKKILTAPLLAELSNVAEAVTVDERIEEYMVAVIGASRDKTKGKFPFARHIEYGASTRAALALYRCSKVAALFDGRGYVLPDDVKAMSAPVLRHRIILSYEAESEELTPDDVIAQILGAIPVP
jgi:MoxR-like ATPase